ncbi:unnamed protein product [Phaedon cochleariae]|uniref:Targeting protein for Xklp2 homolog n=1 Tax=Phaedon cochleariae TaxID=80249 RepID=A0A9P0GSW6_PHACE|nr:unnamed protein product [Phaedon cochleariae]
MSRIMGESFDNFNAPQFFDFSKNSTEHDGVDGYFEMDHESKKDPLEMESADSSSSTLVPEYSQNGNHYFRRSMSVGDINYLRALDTREPQMISEDIECTLQPALTNLRKMGSYASLNGLGQKTKENKAGLSRSSKTISRESIDRLAQPKRRQFSSNQELNRNNYMPVAEYLNKLQNSTPERFRRKPKQDDAFKFHPKLKTTIPQSPHLISTKRNRPTNVLSQDQQEKQDFEEAQKFKIKAHPVNKRILNGPMKPAVQVQKKPSTIPRPFKLTAPLKKVPDSPKKEYEFHANPVPKSLHEPPKPKTHRLPVTEPQTPKFMKHLAKEPVKPQPVEEEPAVRPRSTTILPFSFEMRDMCLRQKRQKLIEKVLEEEKKAREFHARPVPKAILNASKNINSTMKHGSFQRSESQRSLTGSDKSKSSENITCQFKARPATVLVKEPFIPKKMDKPLTEIQKFNLNTEIRAKNREVFDHIVKEKEDQLAMHKMMEEMRRIQAEEEERARLRKMTLYKAQPVKKYKEITIQPSGKVTEPVSPTFLTDKFHPKSHHDNNKENIQ